MRIGKVWLVGAGPGESLGQFAYLGEVRRQRRGGRAVIIDDLGLDDPGGDDFGLDHRGPFLVRRRGAAPARGAGGDPNRIGLGIGFGFAGA